MKKWDTLSVLASLTLCANQLFALPDQTLSDKKADRGFEIGLSLMNGMPTPLSYQFSSIRDPNQVPTALPQENWLFAKGVSLDLAYYPLGGLSRAKDDLVFSPYLADIGLEVIIGAPWDKSTRLTQTECQQSGLFDSCSSQGERISLFAGTFQYYGLKTTVARITLNEEKEQLLRITVHGGFAKSFGHIEGRGSALLSPHGISTGSTSADSWYARLSLSAHTAFPRNYAKHGGAYISLSILYVNQIIDFSPSGMFSKNDDFSFPLSFGLQF